MTYLNNKKGAAVILLTILISSVILAVATGFSTVNIIRYGSDSLVAFYAADAGVEKCLYEIKIDSGSCVNINEISTGTLNNGAKYEVVREAEKSLNSTGIFFDIYRKIELNR